MNFIDAFKIAYESACNTEEFMYVRRKSERFDIRVRPYSQPETKSKVDLTYSKSHFFSFWEWGLCIYPKDIIADDWCVSKEELK